MLIRDLFEGKWWDDTDTVTLYHGTSSALVPLIMKDGLKPPTGELVDYATSILDEYLKNNDALKNDLLKIVPELVTSIQNTTSYNNPTRQRIYCFTNKEDAYGYARSYAEHGGEVAYDIWMSICVALNPDVSLKELKQKYVIPPRFKNAEPVVIEFEVPKSWCVGAKFDYFKPKAMKNWDNRDATASNTTQEEFFDDMLAMYEIKLDKVPVENIRNVLPVSNKITESVNNIPRDIIEYYTTEACGIFAYALWLAYGKPSNGTIGIISRYGEKGWSRSIGFEVTHAFFEINGKNIDILGIHGDMTDEYHSYKGPYDPAYFKNKFMGNSDRKPLYGDGESIKEALEFIRKNPSIYGLNKIVEA